MTKVNYRPTCDWVQDSDGPYQTACGEAFVFNDDGCKENNFKFCCYCGKELREFKFIEDVEDVNMWVHFCPAENTKISVGVGEPCNWCGAQQEDITP